MLLMISAALLMAASPDGSATTTGASQEQDNAAEKMVCKREVVTGSRSKRKRICMSQEQWDRLANNARDDAQKLLDNSRVFDPRDD